MVNAVADAPPLRQCVIRKAHGSEEYGFNLHAEKQRSQYVGTVDPNSPAERGGLRKGDRIVGVNGAIIIGEPHKEVVQKIRTNPLECELLVITEEGMRWYDERNIPINYYMENIVRTKPTEDVRTVPQQTTKINVNGHSDHDNSADSAFDEPTTFVSTNRLELRASQIRRNGWQKPQSAEPPVEENTDSHTKSGSVVSETQSDFAAAEPRPPSAMSPRPLLCHLRKQRPTDEFGFNLHAERLKGHFIGSVDKHGIADRAGLETGQRIVGVNGELIYPNSAHKEVVALIKRDPLDTILLVAGEDVDRWYTENGIPYSFDLAHIHESARRSTVTSRTPTVMSQNSATNGATPLNGSHSPNSLNNEDIAAPTFVEEPVTEMAVDVPNDEHKEESASDLLDAVFMNVKPPAEEPQEQPIKHHQEPVDQIDKGSNHNIPKSISPNSTGSNGTPPSPPTVYTPQSQYTVGLGSPHSDSRSLSSPDSNKDIFKLSAKEARQMMRQRRKDPRIHANLTLEEKHQLIANL